MDFFLENILFWIILAAVIGAVGFAAFWGNRNLKQLGYTVLASLLVLALGGGLFFFVDTNQKSVSRMLWKLSDAIERDDLEGVQQFIEPAATRTRDIARASMTVVRVSKARFQELTIAVNEANTVNISFTAVIHWKMKQPVDGFILEQPAIELVKFKVELVKNGQTWLVTDRCEFTYRGQNSNHF